jgi:hypothetical protein
MATRGPGVLGSLAAAALVLACTAGLLRLLDAVPDLVGSSTRERRLASVEELDRGWRRRLLLPGYFPRALGWPPSSVRTIGKPVHTVVLGFAGAGGGEERLLLAQAEGERLPPGLLPPGVLLGSARAVVEGREVDLGRLLGADGFLWNQVSWTREGRALVLRSRESEEQLLRLAASLRSEGP